LVNTPFDGIADVHELLRCWSRPPFAGGVSAVRSMRRIVASFISSRRCRLSGAHVLFRFYPVGAAAPLSAMGLGACSGYVRGIRPDPGRAEARVFRSGADGTAPVAGARWQLRSIRRARGTGRWLSRARHQELDDLQRSAMAS
jgi:hypothetical protein